MKQMEVQFVPHLHGSSASAHQNNDTAMLLRSVTYRCFSVCFNFAFKCHFNDWKKVESRPLKVQLSFKMFVSECAQCLHLIMHLYRVPAMFIHILIKRICMRLIPVLCAPCASVHIDFRVDQQTRSACFCSDARLCLPAS